MTDRILFSNFAISTLASGITNVATTLNLAAGTGAKYPSAGAGQYFMATLFNTAGVKEVIKVTARSTDQLTIVRGQEGTTAVAWIAGDGIVGGFLTAGVADQFAQKRDLDYLTAGGTGNAITLTPDPALGAYEATKKIRFRVTAANTAAVTVNVNGLGTRGLKKLTGSEIVAGELFVGQIVEAYDNGTEYRIVSDLPDRTEQYVTASGTDTYTASLTPAATGLVAGQKYRVRFTNANLTTAPTINFDATGAKTIKMIGSLSLGRCDIRDNHDAELLYDGTDMILLNPSDVGLLEFSPMSTARGGRLACGYQAVSRTTYATLYKYLNQTATVTITIASPGVVTWTAHGRNANDPVKFTTTGTLPTGIVAGTTYYVVGASIAADTFQVSAAPNGTAINTSGSSSGTHTGIHSPHGDGDGSTTFNLPDYRGYAPVGMDNLGGASANRVTGAWADGIAGESGAETHTLTTAETASHTHGQQVTLDGNTLVSQIYTTGGGFGRDVDVAPVRTNITGDAIIQIPTSSNGGGGAHNNMQPSKATFVMIRF